jgi:hypothetical protein
MFFTCQQPTLHSPNICSSRTKAHPTEDTEAAEGATTIATRLPQFEFYLSILSASTQYLDFDIQSPNQTATS